MYNILLYDVVDDYLARREPLRARHLELIRQAHDRGELVMAGAFADPADGAALLFTGNDRTAAERFAENDPYVKEGLVTRWRVRTWNVVVGGDAG
ncbi:MAG TPA: YciI-like protein [Candidatus Dormibacteraeota bacterium]|nr:YciI-like protein [Candidatus Dormibacteraeota bacterium]